MHTQCRSNLMRILHTNQKKNKNNRPPMRLFRKQKKNKVSTPVCAIFIRVTEMKTKAKKIYLTIFLFVVSLCDICFIVRYVFFCTIFNRRIRIKTKQFRKKNLEKKKYFPLILYDGDADFFIRESQISMGGC